MKGFSNQLARPSTSHKDESNLRVVQGPATSPAKPEPSPEKGAMDADVKSPSKAKGDVASPSANGDVSNKSINSNPDNLIRIKMNSRFGPPKKAVTILPNANGNKLEAGAGLPGTGLSKEGGDAQKVIYLNGIFGF